VRGFTSEPTETLPVRRQLKSLEVTVSMTNCLPSASTAASRWLATSAFRT
jgi:hypothetical protein